MGSIHGAKSLYLWISICRCVLEKVRKKYFPQESVENCYVERSECEGSSLQWHKLLVDLNPPLTEDTVLFFGVQQQQHEVEEAKKEKPPSYSVVETDELKESCIKALKTTWPVLDLFDVTVSDLRWNKKITDKQHMFVSGKENITTTWKRNWFSVDLSKGQKNNSPNSEELGMDRVLKELYVSREVVSQHLTFKVDKITLTKSQLDKVKTIGDLEKNQNKQEHEAAKFLKEVPMEICLPTFGVGGWYRATTEVSHYNHFISFITLYLNTTGCPKDDSNSNP